MKNLAIWSYVVENGSKVYKTDFFLMYLFNFKRSVEEKIHFADGICKDEFGAVLGIMCKCGSAHPFIEGKINWGISIQEEIELIKN